MKTFFKEELLALRRFLKRNSPETIIIVAATLFLTLNRYHPISRQWISETLYFGVFPLLTILLILRKNPLDFGLGIGNPALWRRWVLFTCLAAEVILYSVSFVPSLEKYYLVNNFAFIPFFFTSAFSLGAQEFMYRGFLLFGLKNRFKEGSILLQMVPFALLHLGKPEAETYSTILTGILFGYIAYRTKSFWPAFFIHLFINVFFITLVNHRFAGVLIR